MKLWQKILLAMFIGVLLGYILNVNSPLHIDGKVALKTWLLPLGNAFLDLIKMVVVPLIFFSLVSGITNITDSETFKRIGLKALVASFSTAAFAVLIGIAFATVFEPGKGVNLDVLLKNVDSKLPSNTKGEFSLATFISDIVPNNVIGCMSSNDHILQVVVVAIFTALTINSLGEEAAFAREFCHSAARIVFKMIEGIMKLAPYGVFAIMASLISAQGIGILHDLAILILTLIAGLLVQYLLFGLLIIVFAKMSPVPFYRKVLEIQSLAFSTSSSKATLPTAMRVLHEQMGVSKNNTSFLFPLVASINLTGTAIYIGICALFVAQASGIHLSVPQYILLVFTATIGSVGAAGIPSGGIVMMGMVFSSIGLPLGGLSVILGVDRVLDMLRTSLNMTGVSMITLLIDKSEGTLDEKIYKTVK